MKYVKIGNTTFPEIIIDGTLIIDYPTYEPSLSKKITEEGCKRLKELEEMFRKFKEDNELEIILNEKKM